MIVAGFGGTSRATLDSYRDAYARAGRADRLASLPSKTGVLALAHALDLPFVVVTDVAAIQTPTQSRSSLAAHGTGSVAEACALAAAGPGAVITVTRVISADGQATCALAQIAAMGGA
ncbi:MAG: cobalamin biosynthesis protein [Roseinatronobacter sp.]